MKLTTTVTFIPSDSGQPAVPVQMFPNDRAIPLKVIEMANSALSEDGTYVINVMVDEPTSQYIEIPVPTSTRLKTYSNAVADASVIVEPDDPRLFPPISTFYPRLLQRIKNAVLAAVERGNQ